MKQDWFKSAFGRDYLSIYRHRCAKSAGEEVSFILGKLGEKAVQEALMLDLGCGAGRHLRSLEDLGCNVWGLDLSPELLDEAKKASKKLLRADMRFLPWKNSSFDVLLCLFTGFGYFSDAENQSALREWARVLKPGGRLLLDGPNPKHLKKHLVPISEERCDGFRLLQERTITPEGRVEKKIRFSRDPGGETKEYLESVRLYDKQELEQMLKGAGFQIEACYGNFKGNPVSDENDRLIVFAQKKR